MSAQSNEARPSIDDILSSIRQMIAEDDASEDGSGAPRNDASAAATDANGGRGHDGPDGNAEPDEDVLDLSEEFIVTDPATAPHEFTPATQNQPEALAAIAAGTADAGETIDGETDESPSDEAIEIEAADVWTTDFQMPVGESGPASPFTVARTHPESAWPGDDSVDVTDLYSRARSLSPQQKAEEPGAHDDRHELGADVMPNEAQPARPQEPYAHPADEASEQGIELASLGKQTDGVDPGPETRTGASGELGSAGGDPEQSATMTGHHHAVAEIEAAFGMPPRGWGAPEQVDSAEPEEAVENDHPQRAPHNAETRVGAFDELAETQTFVEQRGHDQHDDLRGLVSEALSQQEADHEDAASTVSDVAPLEAEPATDAAPFQQPAVMPSALPMEPSHAVAPSGSATSKTLEDSVKELLRPMLQEWLDKNMPRLVEAAMREQFSASQDTQPLPDEMRADPTRDDHD